MPLETNRFHVSLCLVGNFYGLPSSALVKAREAAAGIMVRPFKVMFDRAMSFAGRQGSRPLVLCRGEGTAGLEMLQDAVERAMAKAGFRDSISPHCHPHVTLLYGDHDLPEQPVEPISWMVREVVSVHSVHGYTTYRSEGRWLLRDGAPAEPVADHDVGLRSSPPKDNNKNPKENDE